MIVADTVEYSGLFDSLFHFGTSSKGRVTALSPPKQASAKLSFPSLGIGKPATLQISGWNAKPHYSWLEKSLNIKTPKLNIPKQYLRHRKSNPFGTFFKTVWKKGIAPALTLGLTYATQRAVLKAMGVKHPEVILAQQLGLPAPRPVSTISTSPPTYTPPPTTTTVTSPPPQQPTPKPQPTYRPPGSSSTANPQPVVVVQSQTPQQGKSIPKWMLYAAGGLVLAILLSRR